MRENGAIIWIPPDHPLIANIGRLLERYIRKEFRDIYEVELALFEFVLEYERFAHETAYPSDAREKLLAEARARIIAKPRQAINVETLAAYYGLTRSHFSHFFKTHTGMTPAHYIAEVRAKEAAQMLLESDLPLKDVAAAWGFADVPHFCKVFRRFQYMSPGGYRQALGWRPGAHPDRRSQ